MSDSKTRKQQVTKLPAPVVSVVMPSYNRADLLPQSIASILEQDFDDLELLIVDDGSTDNTTEVLRDIQSQDQRLRHTKLKENRGVGHARNVGSEHVSGRYVAHADSDDMWLPGKLRAQVEAMEKDPSIDILFGDFWNIDHSLGAKDRAFELEKIGLNHLVVRHTGGDLYIVDAGFEIGYLRKVFVQLGTVIHRADILRKYGNFSVLLSGTEDYEFIFRMAVLGARFAYLDRQLLERHWVSSSVTADPSSALKGMLNVIPMHRQICKEADRPELLMHVSAAEHRIWRNLIRHYCDSGNAGEMLKAYQASLRRGFSLRTLAIFILAMGGPNLLSFATNLRTMTAANSTQFSNDPS